MTKKEDQKQRNKEILYSALRLQNHSKKSILSVMQSMGESVDASNIDLGSTENVKVFLDDIKKSLDLCNENISTLEKLTKQIDSISIWNSVNSNDNEADDSSSNITPVTGDTIIYEKIDFEQIAQREESKKINNIENNSNNSNNKYVENTLVISETKKNVILPYTISTLNQELKESNNYSSIDEIIRNEYSIPISAYRNPFISRFKEGYRLMRHKEKSSIKEAFDLGRELMFNYNLHPAIISACKNIDELDIYLDYLESGETNKFKFFKVLFEVAPAITKAKHSF